MIFSPGPVNNYKIGSIIPIIWSVALAKYTKYDGVVHILVDRLSTYKQIDGSSPFEVATWVNKKLNYNVHTMPYQLLTVDDFNDYVELYEIERRWWKCECGNVEYIDYNDSIKMKMVNNNRCVLCNSPVKFEKRQGVVAKVSIDNLVHILERVNGISYFPVHNEKSILNLVRRFIDLEILVTRSRFTGYIMEFNNKIYNIDPTIYNAVVTNKYLARLSDSPNEYTQISGYSLMHTAALEILLSRYLGNRVFIPRLNINNINLIKDLDPQVTEILILASTTWKKEVALGNVQGIKYIARNLDKIQKKLLSIDDLDLSNLNKYLGSKVLNVNVKYNE